MRRNYVVKIANKVLVSCFLLTATVMPVLASLDRNIDVEQQELIQVKGKVYDNQTNQPLGNVSIMVNGKTIGQTKGDGTFQLSVLKGTTVRFRLVGYEESQVKVSKNEIEIALTNSETAIDEVIVTALGIKRDEKSLGYATTVVKGEDLTDALSSNWMDALSGKVAGLNLMRSNAGPVGATKIILRGEANLTGENQALIIVDGIVINGGSGRRSANSAD